MISSCSRAPVFAGATPHTCVHTVEPPPNFPAFLPSFPTPRVCVVQNISEPPWVFENMASRVSMPEAMDA